MGIFVVLLVLLFLGFGFACLFMLYSRNRHENLFERGGNPLSFAQREKHTHAHV